MELFKTNCLLRGEEAQKETEDPDCYKFSGTFKKKKIRTFCFSKTRIWGVILIDFHAIAR